jgi:hypothetical protein
MRSTVERKRPDTIEGVSESRTHVKNSRIPDSVWHPRRA